MRELRSSDIALLNDLDCLICGKIKTWPHMAIVHHLQLNKDIESRFQWIQKQRVLR